MQFTLSALITLAIVTLAVATPTRRNTPPATSECDTGSTECCDSTSTASNPVTAALLGSLGIPIGSVTGLVGLTCSPLTVVGASGTSCSAQPVCCTNNSFNGVVALGCTPINLNA
ncbi:hydrophobin-315 [Pholiota molesta]|nr:hydrophobin-315 [Pholiota molesta]